ncbi:unnamed protein product [Protopolystoma xenopodis]|uniref:DH domain-containing protein n=1 Tax=Protopolystoma xenopodis TaxID=117903 RepID=A0A448XC96_9PLAT|nr:unnamed protein product [Protopolystoma xenopodis]
MQPILELVYSEEVYVRALRLVKENYIPVAANAKAIVSISSTPFCSNSETGGDSGILNCSSILSNAPPVPDDLAARWRILWGNWIQLFEWHSNFLDRLQSAVESDPDKIPKLFIDSQARLRSIYSKYCENHRKAALIGEQYRDYFEELRLHVGDKEDVVSHLMRPVQRIMRYQLPMQEIVKHTARANCSSLPLWQKALTIMKEIPKDTQLILET